MTAVITGRHATPVVAASSLQAQLDCVPGLVLRLDARGVITHVSGAWQHAAHAGAVDGLGELGLGRCYLEVCEREIARQLSELLAGRFASFTTRYPCHAPERRRWFRIDACRSPEPEPAVIVTHSDVTPEEQAEIRAQIQAKASETCTLRKPLLAACREVAQVTCALLAWDYFAVWTLDPKSWTLRCVDLWTPPALGLTTFEQATRAAALAPGVGLPGRAWASRHGTWATDRAVDPSKSPGWTVIPPAAQRAGFCSGFAVPFACDDDVLAVVELFGRIRESDDAELLRVLELAGAQIALAELRERADRRAEHAQSEADAARELLEAVLDCAPAFIAAVDRHGAIQFVNKATANRSRDSMVGTSWTEHVAAADQARIGAVLQSVLADGTVRSYETSAQTVDGTSGHYVNYVGPMHRGREITGAVLVAQDVTELRRAELALSESQRLASIGTLAAGVAHEINTPLQFINDNVEFLRDATSDLLALPPQVVQLSATLAEGASPALKARLSELDAQLARLDYDYLRDNVPQAVALCVDGLERVTTIVRSLKEFSHPAHQVMVGVDLNRAIMATLTVARNEYKYVAELETVLGDIPPVVCHVNQINQAVLNILINACHAIADQTRITGRLGVIRVRTFLEGQRVVIAIRDTGTGIPVEARGRIFDPFFTTKEVGRGTGQGLAMAWNTVKKTHGGELSFETTLGEGTEFFIRLPVETVPTRV
ncbi:MAG: ATP-binding protein [Polyangiales bacterium]